jgi:hypothetical protein
MALTLLVAIFTNLQVNTHDLVLLVLPGALGLSCLYGLPGRDRERVVWYALLWASYLLPAYFLNAAFGLNTLLMAALLAMMLVVLTKRGKPAVLQ